MALPKKHRLIKEKDIKFALKTGLQLDSKFFKIKLKKNLINKPRFLVVVSKKLFKKAFYRNTIKRRTLGVIQRLLFSHTLEFKEFDHIWLVKNQQILKATVEELEKDFTSSLKYLYFKKLKTPTSQNSNTSPR